MDEKIIAAGQLKERPRLLLCPSAIQERWLFPHGRLEPKEIEVRRRDIGEPGLGQLIVEFDSIGEAAAADCTRDRRERV